MKLPFIVPRHGDLLSQVLAGKPGELMPKRKRNPELKDVRTVGPNMVEAHHGLLHILYSYKTPVAILAPSGIYKTDKFHSVTTSKHIGKWIRSWNLDPKGAGEIGQDEIEQCAENGTDPQKVVRSRNAPRGEKITARDVSVTKNINGYWVLATIKDGHRVQNVYGGYSKRDAMREFLQAVNGPQKNAPRRKARKTARRSRLLKEMAFFKKHAGGQVGHTAATALSLSKAEAEARKRGWEYEYQYEQERYEDVYGEKDPGGEWVTVILNDAKGRHLASLGFVDAKDTSYVRVVRAELASEALAEGGVHRRHPKKNPRKRAKSVRVLKVGKRFVKRTALRRAGGKRTVGRRKNPLIGVLGNPPHDGKYLGKVTYIEYTHGHDGQKYYHDFKPPVYAQVTDDGGVKLWHPTEKLWKLFPEPK